MTDLAVCHYNIALPIITTWPVKYTHNDRNSHILYSDSGPRGLCVIPQASTQEVIVIVIPVRDGGAQHRSMDTPTPPYRVADPDAAAKVHTVDGYPRAEGLDPTTTSEPRYDPDTVCEAV